MSIARVLIASIIMVVTVFVLNSMSHVETIEPKKPFADFPLQIKEWKGIKQRFDDEIYRVLGVDDSILCTYRSPDHKEIQLYVGYYQSQSEGDQIHSPKHCLPGAGWKITDTTTIDLDIPYGNSNKIKVIKLIMQKGMQKEMVLYWFQSRGRIISSEYSQRIYRVIDSIVKHRTDGSFVRLIAPVLNDNEAKTLSDMTGFIKLLFPILKEYIPS